MLLTSLIKHLEILDNMETQIYQTGYGPFDSAMSQEQRDKLKAIKLHEAYNNWVDPEGLAMCYVEPIQKEVWDLLQLAFGEQQVDKYKWC